jgi:peptidoglycan/xylan/chitin deacetylase (PgdA/CDA1 family)
VYDLAPSRLLVRRGPADRRLVALTFDDGPDDLTLRYLDTLDALGVYATFFIMGDSSQDRRDVVLEYVRRGHQVAGHGFSHTKFTTLSRVALLTELAKTEEQLPPATTPRPWVRPPYGAIGPRSLAVCAAAGYTVALWSFDSLDYDHRPPDALVERCAPANVRPGEVMLFHEGYESTLAALPRIVENLREAGYGFATMAELVG